MGIPAQPSTMERDNRDTIVSLGTVPVEVLEQLDLGDPETWPPLLESRP